MDRLNNGIVLLSRTFAGMQNGDGKTDLYTVPTGKSMIPVYAIVRNPTGSLSGGTDYDFGDGASANTWLNAVDLSGLTATTDFYIVSSDNTKYTVFDAGDVFGIIPVTGATADVNAIIDLFGCLF